MNRMTGNLQGRLACLRATQTHGSHGSKVLVQGSTEHAIAQMKVPSVLSHSCQFALHLIFLEVAWVGVSNPRIK